MTAEAIARVIHDIRHTTPLNALAMRQGERSGRQAEVLYQMALEFSRLGPVVDATGIYHALVDKDEPIDLYGEWDCLAPPWDFGQICYVNEHGNVIVMACMAVDWHDKRTQVEGRALDVDKNTWRDAAQMMERLVGGRSSNLWNTDEDINWDDVRWTVDTFLWIGGRGAKGPQATFGPNHMWRSALYDDGTPADLHWIQLNHEYPMENWDMAHMTLLAALNFCNASNTEIREPVRPRAEAKRIARTGVTVSQIHLKPTRKQAAAGEKGDPLNLAPLHGVRGHMAHFGDCCPGRHEPNGLAFGKLTGRYWIPFHARGSRDNGEVVQSYVLEPE